MSTAGQQAGATEREAVERLARWRWPEAHIDDSGFWNDKSAVWVCWPNELDGARELNPFTNPADERDLLTAVQERWGRPACEDVDAGGAFERFNAFVSSLRKAAKSRLPLRPTFDSLVHSAFAYIQPGDIARAVDAVLREYGE